MNTSAIGARYERAFKHELYRRGAYEVMRAAASKGTFDLISIEADAICGYQLKAGAMSCRKALELAQSLNCKEWPNFLGYVVHKTKAKEFCEH